jgi:hypothetical protein
MAGKYAYSISGDQYRGTFSSREEALAEAIVHARRSPDGPQTVYIGRMVPADPKAGGHARAVLSNMAARAKEEFGDAASEYLTGLSPKLLDNLDETLELVIRGWLNRHELMPDFFKVDAIGEYRVPGGPNDRAHSDMREVQEIGSGTDADE